MKRKELKNVAKQIAKYERIIQTTDDKNERHSAEMAIIQLSNKIEDLTDIMELDELIKEYLEENS
jgi:hypothetical protein